PAPVEDVHVAIRWVKAHAQEFNIDPNRIALVGESAGGQLVAQAAVLAKEDTRVAAVVPFYAPVDFIADMERRGGLSTSMRGLFGRAEAKADETTLQLLREASPINHVRAGLPPFLLVHGTGDMSVLYSWSPQFQSKLKAVGVECDLITIPDGRHGMASWESFAPEYKEQVADWLARHLNTKSVSLPQKESGAYLFAYFKNNGEDGLHLAWSGDGLKWQALNNDMPFIAPAVGSQKLMRDPHVLQGPDGVFHMVWTTGWEGRDIGIAHSKDL